MNVIVQRRQSAPNHQSTPRQRLATMLTYEFPIEIQTLDELLPLACIILGIPNPNIRSTIGNEEQYRKSMVSDLTNLDLNSSLVGDRVSVTV
jgi:hypothetical protein